MGLETNVGLSGYGVGGGFGGGANMGFSMPVAPAHGGGHSCIPYPVMMGNNGFGNGFGGDGIWAILLLSLLNGRNGWGNNGGCDNGFGGGAGVANLVQDNINGRFSALSDQITNGDNAILTSNQTQNLLAAVHGVDSNVCAGFLQNANSFAQTRLDTCNQTGLINNNIADVKFQGALGDQRLSAQIADCCCTTKEQIMESRFQAERNTCNIINAIHADGEATRGLITQNTIQDLRDRLQDAKFLNSQISQTCELKQAINPPIVNAVPVSGSQPIFRNVISAESLCGFGGSSFRPNNNCGCGGF